MSVLIKMPMPQNCYECRFCETYLGHHLCVAFLNYIAEPRSGRLDTCPLEELPTIEPKHGRWIKHVLKNANVPWGYDCSACGAWFVVGEDTVEKYYYCPNCGARMERSEK